MPPNRKLLVADDSLTIQKVIRLALSNEGYDIQAISDGNDAVEQISVFRPAVVLIDVSLPSQSAFDVKRSVNALPDLKDVRFVLMSSAFEKVDEAQAGEVGFDGRLTKPFDPAHLRHVLSTVLATIPASAGGPAAAPSPSTKAPALPPLPQAPTQAAPQPPSPMTPIAESLPPLPSQTQRFSGVTRQPAPPVLPDLPELPKVWPSEPVLPPPVGGSDFPSAPSFPFDFQVQEPPAAFPDPLDPIGPMDPIQPMETPPMANEASRASGEDADIKQLTESTIRLSGLDDFQWSIQEPTLKPIPSMSDTGGSNFPADELTKSSSYSRAPDPFSPFGEEPTKKIQLPKPARETPPASSYSAPTRDPSDFLQSAEFERMVQKQVQESLEKIARQILPEIAERVIKAEIHRLLSEMP